MLCDSVEKKAKLFLGKYNYSEVINQIDLNLRNCLKNSFFFFVKIVTGSVTLIENLYWIFSALIQLFVSVLN